MKFEEIQPMNDVERLILLRKRLNMNQFQFAKELGISTSYLGQVERGKCSFSLNLKQRIQDYLNKEKSLYGFDVLGN